LSSAQRLLDTLALFTPRRPAWTPERAAQALGVSRASAYRYFALLSAADFIEATPGRGYALGPAVIELDRQIRLSDPLVQTAADTMLDLARGTGGAILLCRLYRGRVLCVHQERGAAVPAAISYERGRPMPLYRGATSKAILAFLPQRALVELALRDRAEIVRAGLPTDGAALWRSLEAVRAKRICVTHSEIDAGACGAAVPLFERERVIGSLSVVLPAASLAGASLKRATRLLARAGQRIEADIAAFKPRRAAGKKAT
jgi:DNA-binding IclR family transcriptional regulator